MSRKTHSTRPWWWAFFLFFSSFSLELTWVCGDYEKNSHTHGEAAENEPKMGDALLYTHTRSRPCSVREIVILVYLAQVKVSSRLVEKTKKTELRLVGVGEGFVFSLSLSLSLSLAFSVFSLILPAVFRTAGQQNLRRVAMRDPPDNKRQQS